MLKSLIAGIIALFAATLGLHHATVSTTHAARSPYADTGAAQVAATAAAIIATPATTTPSFQDLSSPAQSTPQPAQPQSSPVVPARQSPPALDPLGDYVTPGDLGAQINDLQSWIREYVAQATSTGPGTQVPQQVAAGGNPEFVATAQINNLVGSSQSPLTISNATLSDVSGLTASEIPDLSGHYLSLNGGAVVGTSTFPAVGIGTTSPGSIFSIAGVANWTGATTTYYATGGINLAGGCFSINGACITGSGGGSGTVTSGTQGQFAFYNANGTTLSGTSTLFAALNGNIGVGTTSPATKLSISGNTYLTGGLGVGTLNTTSGTLQTSGSATIGGALTAENITSSALNSYGLPTLVRGNSSSALSSVPAPSSSPAPFIYFSQLSTCTWSSGTVTCNTRSSNTYNGNGLDYITITDAANTGFNGTYPLTGATSGTISYPLASNPGAWSGGSDCGGGAGGCADLVLEPTIQIQPNSPGGTALMLTPNPNCVPDGYDVGQPIFAVSSGYHNYTFEIGCDAHSVSIWSGGYRDWFNNGNVEASVATHYIGWSNSATADPASATNIDTVLCRGGAGVLEIGTSSTCGDGGALLARIIGIGTSSPSSRLTVWGPDTASTTAFNVVNSASTTVFAVYDSGNATYSGSIFQSSDERLKADVQSLDASSSLSLLQELNPVSYLRIDQPGGGENLGFLAQQVGAVFPELVSTTSPTELTPDGTLTLNYEGLIAPIVGGIQQLASEIASLESTVAGFAESFVSQQITATTELCVGSTCVSAAQFQAMVAAATQSEAQSSSEEGSSGSGGQATSSPDTPPVIQINGDNPATVDVGTTYQDLGATNTGPQADLNLGVEASVDGGATTTPDQLTVDTSEAGTHTIIYCATDQSGLGACVTRTINVVSAISNATTTDATSTSD